MGPGEVIDLGKLFQRTFGGRPYLIAKDGTLSDNPGELYKLTTSLQDGSINGELSTPAGSKLAEKYLGVEIWLPTHFYVGSTEIAYLPYSVIKITGKKTIIRTPLPERVGTVKEVYNIDDYAISIKGFLIGNISSRLQGFPEDQLINLRQLFEMQTAVTIDNAISNIFLKQKGLTADEQRRVIITSFELPEVEGGRKNVRPFILEMESDAIFTLELQ